MDLVDLSDGDNRVRVRVRGRRAEGILPLHDLLDAEIVVESSFVRGRLRVGLYPADLASWSVVLDSLDRGQDAGWLDQGNGPVVRFEFSDDDRDCPTVLVEDASASGAYVGVPVALEGEWVEEQREHLREVERAWPSEVLVTAPGAYEWRSGSGRGGGSGSGRGSGSGSGRGSS
ncbi:DUF5959 family protein [Streptomyces liangshanensis]|uniref:DUF5959 family protein n=1 Tax=Streptomyces liangshanensis TaxID=2717324 RepID=UPI0036DE81BC